jgi:drug/metabolite transporter (DMT)-like permease
MKRFHLIFGLLAVIVFLLTGKYMDLYLGHLRGMPDGTRMLYRTRHIYILLAGLLNLGIGTYFRQRLFKGRRVIQMLGSVLIVLATLLFVAGFVYEPKLPRLETPFSHWGMYAIFAGTFLHVLGGLGPRGADAELKD